MKWDKLTRTGKSRLYRSLTQSSQYERWAFGRTLLEIICKRKQKNSIWRLDLNKRTQFYYITVAINSPVQLQTNSQPITIVKRLKHVCLFTKKVVVIFSERNNASFKIDEAAWMLTILFFLSNRSPVRVRHILSMDCSWEHLIVFQPPRQR